MTNRQCKLDVQEWFAPPPLTSVVKTNNSSFHQVISLVTGLPRLILIPHRSRQWCLSSALLRLAQFLSKVPLSRSLTLQGMVIHLPSFYLGGGGHEVEYLWGKDHHVTVHHLAKNTYIFHILSPSLRRHILQHELWGFQSTTLDRAPVWEKINCIPFDMITYEGLSCVCTPLGHVVDSKPFTSISSAEVKVIVDLTNPLSSEMELECEDGCVMLLEVTYPWLLPFCPLCTKIFHKAAFCPDVLAKEKLSFEEPKENAEEEWNQVHSKKKKRKGKSKVVDSNVVKPVGILLNMRPQPSDHVSFRHSLAQLWCWGNLR
ncbi:hypothetical protein N665_0277s0014, partial [Sinapis alba]